MNLDVDTLGTEELGEFRRYEHASQSQRQIVTTYTPFPTQAGELERGFS